MQYSRRNEVLRYSFPESLPGEFKITKIDGVEVDSNVGTLKIVDLSLNGAQISTEFDLQIEGKEIELTLYFQLMTIDFSISGNLVYQEPYVSRYIYGVHLNTTETTRKQLTEELKAFAWSLVEDTTD